MKTTPEQFEQFKAEFMRYVDIFGLSYKFYWEHKAKKSANAWVSIQDLKDRIATVGLAGNVDVPNVAELAKHEAIELLVGRLVVLAEDRYATENEIDEERHALIRILERIIP